MTASEGNRSPILLILLPENCYIRRIELMHRLLAVSLTLLLSAPALSAATGSDSFYENLVAKGKSQFRAGQAVESEQSLRIGSFGLLSDPDELAEVLVWLALAQNAAHHEADARATAARILDIQQKFSAYERATIDADIRRQFDSVVPQLLSPAAAAGLRTSGRVPAANVPASQPPVESRPVVAPPAVRPETPASSQPRNDSAAVTVDALAQARAATSRNDLSEAVRWSTRALDAQPDNTEALAIRAHARTMLGQWTTALADLGRIPDAALYSRGELLADRFVAYVGLSQWTQASATLADVPASLLQRVDVIASRQKLSKATQASQPAPKTPAPVAVAPQPRPQAPPATTSATPSETVSRQSGEPLTTWVNRAAQTYQSRTPSQPWTVQFQTVCQAASIESAANRGKSNVWFVPMTMGGRSCYRLLWGHYATDAEARRGAATIPSALTAGSKPVVVDARAFTGR